MVGDLLVMPRLCFAKEGSARPHVTLTFAQSSDDKIAGPGKKQLALSCKESMLMTHKLRTMHDGILVGIGTVLNDNPQLNARLLPMPPPVSELPRPVVLDSTLRMPLTCKLLRNHADGIGRQPLIICSKHASPNHIAALVEKGAEVIRSDSADHDSSLDWPAVLSHIRAAGIRRLMVEGGATVITSLLHQQQLIDTLLVTVAPIHVGMHGLGYSAPLPSDKELSTWHARNELLVGVDTVLVWQKNKE